MVNKSFAPAAMTMDRLESRNEVGKRKNKKFCGRKGTEIQSNHYSCIVSTLVLL